MARDMGEFIHFKPGRRKETGRHCTACGGAIYEDQEVTTFAWTKERIKGTAYRHASDDDCARELGNWSDAGHGPGIDERDWSGNAPLNATGRHLRQGMDAP